MTTLREIREALTSVLEPVSAPVVGAMPDRFTPPIAILVPGSPYVESGSEFGSYLVRHRVVVIAGIGEAAPTAQRLDALIEQTAAEIFDASGFYLESIDQPTLYVHGQSTYLSCVVNVSATERLEG